MSTPHPSTTAVAVRGNVTDWPLAALATVAGGLVALVGPLLPWVTLTATSSRRALRDRELLITGTAPIDGKLIMGAAVVGILAGVAAWYARGRGARSALGGISALAGLAVMVIAVVDMLTPSRYVTEAARAVADQGGFPIAQAEELTRALIGKGDVEVSPQAGLFLALAGGLVMVVAGVLLLTRATARRRRAVAR